MSTLPTLYDPEEEFLYGFGSPQLTAFEPDLKPGPEVYPAPSPPPLSKKRRKFVQAPDTEVLLRGLAPNNPELHHVPLPESLPLGGHPAMTDRGEGAEPIHPPTLTTSASDEFSALSIGSALHARDLAAKATAAVEAASTTGDNRDRLETEDRHDSAQDKVPQLPQEQRQRLPGRSSPSLKLQTPSAPPSRDYALADTLTTSPTLSKHIITTTEGFGTLPAYHAASPMKDGITSSPHVEKLPSLQQVVAGQLRPLDVRPLDELADLATQHDPRISGRNHSRSFGSATSHSPMLPSLPYHYGNTSQPATSPYYARGSAKSPTSTISEHMYMSPTQYPGAAYYADRRSDAPADMHPPLLPASLPSASSSAESHGTTSSSVDDYSTAQSTPGEGPDPTQRMMLPPPPGMPLGGQFTGPGFTCDYPGCTAAPFQTQYLLSSHRNVHSQVRNHYCSVKECPRSEGGKGFKRKNEMIRHGLVHDSPGYVCPFCPDKEHKYPRPDNLQRHVRVHHTDKDKEDPQLREVLAQRREGVGKTRRRRANTAGSGS